MKHIQLIQGYILIISVLFMASCSPNQALNSPVPIRPTQIQSPVPTEIPGPGQCRSIGQAWTSPLDGTTLVCVPAGKFLMGASDSDPLAAQDEKPQHSVYLDAYWIDRTEVTNAEFAKCMSAGACHPKVYETTAQTYNPYSVHPGYQDYPALVYEYDAAAEYCQWAGRRLPAEAEWEKAARGTDGRSYPWGNSPLDCTMANYYECNVFSSDNSTAPRCGGTAHCDTSQVDSHAQGASPYGVLNMAGNVWEWVADWYQADYYATSPMNNPQGPTEGEYRVIRGGGAKSLPQDLRSVVRSSGEPQHYLDGQLGLRCAMSAGNP